MLRLIAVRINVHVNFEHHGRSAGRRGAVQRHRPR